MIDSSSLNDAQIGYCKNKRLYHTASFLKNTDMDGYQRLANAIIEQAAKDYRNDSYILRTKAPKSKVYKKAVSDLKRIEQFFRSDWFKELTNIDGEWLLGKLQEERR